MIKYDPYRNTDESHLQEDQARWEQERLEGREHTPKEDKTWAKVLAGSKGYELLWRNIRAKWEAVAQSKGWPIDERPPVLYVPLDANGQFLSTEDETVHSNGCMCDGTPLGSPVAVHRSSRNMNHVTGIYNTAKARSCTVEEVKENLMWNWTLACPFDARHECEGHVVHRVGQRAMVVGRLEDGRLWPTQWLFSPDPRLHAIKVDMFYPTKGRKAKVEEKIF